jgi:hypothetical protein
MPGPKRQVTFRTHHRCCRVGLIFILATEEGVDGLEADTRH